MDKIVLIAIKDATRNFDILYTYSVNSQDSINPMPGMRVMVPFGKGNRSVEGFIYHVRDYSDEIDAKIKNIKKIDSIIDKTPVMSQELIELSQYMKQRYICTYYDALRVMMPVFSPQAKEKTIKAVFLSKDKDEVLEDLESNRFDKIGQIRTLEILLENEYIGMQDLILFAGISRSTLNTLKKHGYIDFGDIEVRRDPFLHSEIIPTMPLIPTREQEEVLDYISQIPLNTFREILLHGVTGSGKTEVYLQLIDKCIGAGNQAIVLVPEISLTPQMVNRFKSRFGDRVAVLHSRLSPGERYDQWRAIKEGHIKVAIGARSAVFAPFDNIGIIVMDEEHEPSYKSEITPKYDCWEVAKKRCEFSGALLIYGSATPSVTSYHRTLNGEVKLLKLQSRPNSSRLPEVHVVDLRLELEAGNRSMFSGLLQQEISKNISNNQQTMLFINRRGYASFVLCRTCGKAVSCGHCNVSMTYHLNSSRLICHYCGYTISIPTTCPSCNSKSIKTFGTGTQKIEDEVKKTFNASVIRMDMDTTTRKNSHENILNKFRDENINVMIGTQMIAKGHDFPNVTLVGVLAADALLNSGDFRATERTFQLLTQVAGRAGRGELSGRVIFQSYNIDHYSVICSTSHDYETFYKNEIALRERMEYPPFTNIGVIVISGVDDAQTQTRAMSVFESLEKNTEGFDITVSKPMKAPISRIKDRFRWRIIIKTKNGDILVQKMTIVADEFYKNNKNSLCELSIDINPFNMI